MATDVVCVLNAALEQVFADARPIKATIREESKTMEHPLETGSSVTDHRVIQPVEIELSFVLASEDYAGTYRQIRNLFARGDLLTVQTRTDSYPSMVIQAMPHEENPEAFDAVQLALTLKEVQFVEAQFATLKVSKPADSRTVKRGEQQATAATPKQQSVLSRIFGK